MAASLECDALAVLVVRLRSDRPSGGERCWHSWEASSGAEPNGLPENGRADRDEPFKSLPRPGSWHYFNEHVERLLFPPSDGGGGRWICCPEDLCLDFRQTPNGPERRARIDLLERITTPLEPKQTYGLIHLSLLPSDEEDAPDTLEWGKGISATFRRGYERFELALVDQGRSSRLA